MLHKELLALRPRAFSNRRKHRAHQRDTLKHHNHKNDKPITIITTFLTRTSSRTYVVYQANRAKEMSLLFRGWRDSPFALSKVNRLVLRLCHSNRDPAISPTIAPIIPFFILLSFLLPYSPLGGKSYIINHIDPACHRILRNAVITITRNQI